MTERTPNRTLGEDHLERRIVALEEQLERMERTAGEIRELVDELEAAK